MNPLALAAVAVSALSLTLSIVLGVHALRRDGRKEQQEHRQEETAERNAQFVELTGTLSITQKALDQERQENATLRGENAELLARIERMERESGRRDRLVAQLAEENSKLRNEVADVRRELDALRTGMKGGA